MRKTTGIAVLLLLMSAVCAMVSMPARADMQKVDELIQKLDKMEFGPKILTLDKCIAIALESNPALRDKVASLNSVEGDIMIDRSRFFSHVDVLASFTRQAGTILKQYYPSYNPQAVSSLGSASIGIESLSGGASGGLSGLSSSSIEQLTGMNMGDIAGLASQYGIDISQFGFRPAADGTISNNSTPAQRAALRDTFSQAVAQRQAGLTITTPLGPVTIDDDQLQSLITSAFGTDTATQQTAADTHLSIRYSRRLMEWGKESVSKTGIRSNRRLAIFNYQQEMRSVLSELRKTFYTILLKKKQIEERKALLEAYEKKLREQQLRYEVAKDVPMIDVLTAELDVLNEKLRINTLRNDMINKKMELLKLMGLPVGLDYDISGNPPELKKFEFSLEEIVNLTKDNSYQVTYLKEEIGETKREMRDIRRDYRPKYSGKFGVEDRRTNLGFTLNNSGNTYGIDMGAEQHLNLSPTNGSGSSLSSSAITSLLSGGTRASDNNYYLSVGVTYLMYDNMKRGGITKKQLENMNKQKAQLDQQELAEELQAREAYQDLQEAIEQLALQEETLVISERRLEITRKLREFGKVAEYQLDSYRSQYFNDQDRLFSAQEAVITAQENLRKIMGVFY